MISLDDPAALAAADPGGMLRAAEGAAGQWEEGVRRARALEGLRPLQGTGAVVACGMGGSGIAGDVLVAVAAERATLPVTVVKGYELPLFVSPATLVVCISYSGNTEETLACFETARERGARLIAVATGGALAERAGAAGIPCVAPVEGFAPRAAFPSLAAIVLTLAERLRLIPSESVSEGARILRDTAAACGREVPEEANTAKRAARALDGLLPLVWGQEGALRVAADRWRCQLNENAKVPAFSSVVPELDHNEIESWSPGLPLLERVGIVALRAPAENPRIAKRVGATAAIVSPRVGRFVSVPVAGETPLGVLLSAAALGDFVSVYLAILRGVDPSPMEAIERLKRELA